MTQPADVRVAVRFSDLDVFGHVNQARYLSFCEEHHNEFLPIMARATGIDLLAAGFVMARVECIYHAALGQHVRDVLVRMSVERVGRTSLNVSYSVVHDDEVAATVSTVLVVVDETGSPRALTASERTFLVSCALNSLDKC